MKTACNKDLEVFDFGEGPEVPELELRIKSKLENPKNAIDKYAFLATAAAGKNIPPEEINYIPSLDIGAIEIDHIATSVVKEVSSAKMTFDSEDVTIVKQHPQYSPKPKTDLSESEVNAPGEPEVHEATTSAPLSDRKINSPSPDLLTNLPKIDETVDMDADDNESMSERSSSASSDFEEDDGVFAGPSSGHGICGWEMANEEIATVVIHPDFLVYQDSYCTDSLLSFTSSSIEMEGSPADGDQITFKLKWAIDDILQIKSHWYPRIEMALVKIHVLMKDTVQVENAACSSGIELKFAVIGSNWYEIPEALASLNVMYKALWSSMLESEDTVLGQTRISCTKYFPNFDQSFDEVVYPKGDVDAVSISKRDFDLLQPDTFVNDTIIDFYIKYLKNKIKPEERHRFHFFNSFFFRKLADPDKDPPNASEGRAAFQRVKKWTRKVNLFEKDYVFIPVNYNYHWSLLVMCHLGEVATCQDGDVNESMKVPCVLHMDSIKGSHSGLKGLLQSYLREEWRERHQEASEDISSRFDDLRFISLELPQQQNSYDCGLFLLHYVELFLDEAPVHFNPFKITKSCNFLNVDWFLPAEASLKRVVIQRLICELLEHPSREAPSTAGNDEHCKLSSNIHKGTAVEFFPEKCNTSLTCQSSQTDHGIGISLTSTPSTDDPNVALKSPFEQRAFLAERYPDFNQTTNFDDFKSSLTPIEEDVEAGGEQFVCSPTETGVEQGNVSNLEASPQKLKSQQNNANFDSSLEASISVYEDSVEIVQKNSQHNAELNFKDNIGQPLTELDGDANRDDLTSSMDILPVISSRFPDTKSNEPMSFECSVGLEFDVQHPSKKMRMTEAPLEDLHL